MKIKASSLVYIALAIVASFSGYLLVNPQATVSPVRARSVEMPAVPNVFYLTMTQQTQGLLNSEAVQENGVVTGQSWLDAQNSEKQQALDALIIEAPFLQSVSQFDKEWLVSKFRDGVVIVGLGADHNVLAEALNLKTLRNSNERPRSFAPNQYLMVQLLWLGQSEDLQKYEASNWLEQQIGGNNTPLDDIQGPVITSFSKSIGEVNSENDMRILFSRISSGVEHAYAQRAEYLALVANSQK